MEPLEPPALHLVKAAYGWLELGNVPEALAELQRLPADCRALPGVRVARLDCLMAAKDWDAAVVLASDLCGEHPGEPGLWLHWAYAKRRCTEGNIESAHYILSQRLDDFPDEWLIPYNLACYLCQMDRLEEAQAMLDRARAQGGEKVDAMAKEDEDLAPLNL